MRLPAMMPRMFGGFVMARDASKWRGGGEQGLFLAREFGAKELKAIFPMGGLRGELLHPVLCAIPPRWCSLRNFAPQRRDGRRGEPGRCWQRGWIEG